MTRRRWAAHGALAGVGAVGALAGTALASAATLVASGAGPVAPSRTGDSDPRAVLLLAQAARAERMTAYSGTQYVSAWRDGTTASFVVDVRHEPGKGTVTQVRPDLGRGGAPVYESDRPGPPAPHDPLAVPRVDGGFLDLLRHNYRLVVGAVAAGTVQVAARRADGSTAARFWLDREHGLTVRREIFDEAGRLVRACAFVQLDVGTVRMTEGTSTVPKTSGHELDRDQVEGLRAGGWVIPDALPGSMLLYDVWRHDTETGTELHLGYSDGLSTASVFVQEGRLASDHLDGWRRVEMGGPVHLHDDGVTRRVSWSGEGRVYTLVADAPPSVVEAMVGGFPHSEEQRGFWGRIAHGMSRLGSWLVPFD